MAQISPAIASLSSSGGCVSSLEQQKQKNPLLLFSSLSSPILSLSLILSVPVQRCLRYYLFWCHLFLESPRCTKKTPPPLILSSHSLSLDLSRILSSAVCATIYSECPRCTKLTAEGKKLSTANKIALRKLFPKPPLIFHDNRGSFSFSPTRIILASRWLQGDPS